MLATLAAAWTLGRIAVRLGDDVSQTLLDTPMEASTRPRCSSASRREGLYVNSRASERGGIFS